MVSRAGLGAVYGGYQQARKVDNEIESRDITNQNARLSQEGEAAWGRTIPVLQQMLQPGASPMPGAGGAPPMQMAAGPQAPSPGQPSQPMRAPNPPPQMLSTPPPPNDPTMSVAPSQAGASPPGSVGDRFGGLPGGGAPQQSAPPMPQPQQRPQPMQQQGQPQQPQAGKLDLHTIMGAVLKANPGANPGVIAHAVAKALPLMTAQAQIDYKNLMVQLSGQREQGRNDRNAAAGQRAELSAQTRLAISTLSSETRREIAAAAEEGRTGRAVLSTQARQEIAKLNSATRLEILGIVEEGKDGRMLATEEGRNNRQLTTETNRNARFTEGETQKNERQGVAEQGRTSRQGVAEQGRMDRAELSANTRSDIARMSVEARRELQDNLEGGRNSRAALSAQTRSEIAQLGADSRAEIQDRLEQGRNTRSGALEEGRNTRNAATLESRGTIAGNKEAGLNERQATRNEFLSQRIKLQSDNLERQLKRDSRLEDNARNRQTLRLMEDENNAEFKRAQQKIAAQNVFAPNKSKEKLTQDAETAYQNAKQRIEQYRTSMGGKGAAPAAGGDQPPPEALKELKEGHVTTFGNGQRWTLQGGKPARVP